VIKHLASRRYLVQFDARRLPQVFCDVLVIGSGVAGLRCAIEAARHANVLIVTKDAPAEGNTHYAQGGIAAVTASDDSFDAHVKDTAQVGQGLCDLAVVRRVIEEAPARLRELMTWGACFDADENGVALTREGGHSHRRIVHAQGDATGAEVEKVLLAHVKQRANIQVVDQAFALDIVTHEGRCVGAILFDKRWGYMLIWARQTVLATGGAGRTYRETTNPPVATGDGLAIAYRAGAELCDMEFMQFHPTTLYVAGASRALISEAMRGEGAILVNSRQERFMEKYHPRGELAPRDVVSRSILQEMKQAKTTHVFLDCRHIGRDHLIKRFPGIRDLCAQFGIDITRDAIPVRPSAHYMVGGVAVGENGRTAVPGLLACGEVACTGLHGANRLGSNSLLEGMVYGYHAGEEAGRCAAEDASLVSRYDLTSALKESGEGAIDLADVRNSLRALMWRNAGIERTGTGLEEAERMIDFWCRYVMRQEFSDREGWELQNMLTVAKIMTVAARRREESRGVHFRADFPEIDDEHWKRHTKIRREEG